jgi:hypothetical protein
MLYLLNRGQNRSIEDIQGELLLTAFLGSRYKCGKQGHRGNQCQNKTASQRFNGKYGSCGKLGHQCKYCWLIEENKVKRPEGWKKGSEKDVVTIDEVNI